jgi:hypothetical protein
MLRSVEILIIPYDSLPRLERRAEPAIRIFVKEEEFTEKFSLG